MVCGSIAVLDHFPDVAMDIIQAIIVWIETAHGTCHDSAFVVSAVSAIRVRHAERVSPGKPQGKQGNDQPEFIFLLYAVGYLRAED